MSYDRVSSKDWFVTLFLGMFTGFLGTHRFYCGKFKIGILYAFTLGCFGIGAAIDLIRIVCKKFRDCEGALVCNSYIVDC